MCCGSTLSYSESDVQQVLLTLSLKCSEYNPKCITLGIRRTVTEIIKGLEFIS